MKGPRSPCVNRSCSDCRPGCQAIVSLADDLVREGLGGRAARLCRALLDSKKPVPAWIGLTIVGLTQLMAERHQAGVRSELLRMDDQLRDRLAFTGRSE